MCYPSTNQDAVANSYPPPSTKAIQFPTKFALFAQLFPYYRRHKLHRCTTSTTISAISIGPRARIRNVGADSTDPRTNSSPIIRTVIGTIARICAPYITGANSTLVILILEDVPPRCSTLLRNNPLSSDYSFSLPLSIRLRSACPAIPPSTSTTYAAPNPPFPPSPFCHDSPHKCMFPGFLVVRRMSYGRSATNARLRRRHRRDCGTRGVKIVGERRRKAARLIGLEKNGGFSLFLLCCSLLNPTNERSYFL